jgi:sugar lactone lactonase YvrE/P pilus assembly chaperone PapD
LKTLCALALAAVVTISAHAQIISTLVGNPDITGKIATAVSIYEPTTVAVDATGNVYFATGNFTSQVYEISTAGTLGLVAGNGAYGYSGDGAGATSAKLSNPAGVAVDRFGTVYIADADASVIRKVDFSTGFISTVAGTGTPGYSGDGHAASTAKLNYPSAVAIDGSGNLYIADTYNNVIRKVDTSGNISTVAGNGTAGYSGDGHAAIGAQLNYPSGVAADSAGNFWIADSNNSVIRKIDISTGNISTVAGNGTAGYSGDGHIATNAQLNYPANLTVDRVGNLYIADSYNSVVRKVSISTGNISTVAGNGTYGSSGNGGLATGAELSYPQGVAVDSTGNLFIAYEINYVLREVNAGSGNISIFAGNGYFSYSGDGGPATNAQFDGAYALTVDGSNNLYFADSYNSVIRKVDASTGTIFTVAGNGIWGYSGDGGAATAAQLSYPYGVAVDNAGNLYIADSDNAVIREVDGSTHTINTVAGNGVAGYSGDGGRAIKAQFDGPRALAMDYLGNLYVAEKGNIVVREIDPSGTISTVAGNGTNGYTGDGGAAVNAQLSGPTGLAVDNSGNLFIADATNAVVREVILNAADTANFGIIKTVAGGGTSADPNNALGAIFAYPSGVFVDYSGAIFVSDAQLSKAFKITGSSFASPASGVVSTVAGNGSTGYSGDGSLATSAELFEPYSLTGDLNGNLLISDINNYRIRSVTSLVTVAPVWVLSVTSLNFDPQVLGQGTTQTKSVTVSNPGSRPLTISSVAISGTNAADFTETDNCTSAAIAARSSCTINVTFAAKISGSETATLTVTSNASKTPATVALSGSGISQPAFTLSSSLLIYATQLLGSGASATKSLTITNSGTAPLTVSSLTFSGTNAADFTQTNTCTSASIAPNSTCTINVVFAATATGSESATLTIVSNAPTSPQTVSLSGAGITFAAPSAASGGSTSATVTSGSTATYSLQVLVTGGANLSDSLTLSLSCSGAPKGATCTGPASVVATPGTPGAFTLTVSTTKISSATVGMVARAGDGLLPKGMGLALIPFGMIMLGISRKRRKLTGLFLLGLLALTVSSIGCGAPASIKSTSNTNGTPVGTYTLSVTATSGSVSKSTALTLIVK